MTREPKFPPQLDLITTLIDELSREAVDFVKDRARKRSFERRKRIGGTRRPGLDTPLWNALVRHVQARLQKRGAKANLGRVLAVPRQRIYDYFTARTMMPDGETVLHLILWLVAEDDQLKRGRHAHPLK